MYIKHKKHCKESLCFMQNRAIVFFHISIGENVDYVKLTKSPYLLLCMLLGFLLSQAISIISK